MTTGSSRQHWLVDLAHGAGYATPDIEFLPGASVAEIWEAVAAASGIAEEDLVPHVAARFHLQAADLTTIDPKGLKLVPSRIAQGHGVLPLREDYRQIVVATCDPTDMEAEQAVSFASGRSVAMEVASPGALQEAIAASYSPDSAADELLRHVNLEAGGDLEILSEEGPRTIDVSETGSGPIVKLTNLIFTEAVNAGASDVHVQPGATGGVVRLRVDGVLRQHLQMPMPVFDRVVSRIKIMGEMDIADRLRPQDGRARVRVGGRKVDLRISTVPTRESEKAVIRLLDPEASTGLSEVNLPELELERFRSLLTHRDGIMVVTGPTGSGKTTTLYGALKELSTADVNIMTVEDPVEYELPGLTQIQVEPKKGVTFASALRAILRQDPDIIFVGEIRDLETAEMAAQASLTGHVVLATLHTNDAAGSIRRLSDLGLDTPAILDTFRGALAQRLIRKVCSKCAETTQGELTEEERRLAYEFGVEPVVRAIGCKECGGSGYRGRLPLVEVFTLSPAIQELVREGATSSELNAEAEKKGMRTLRTVGLERVRNGETTLQELSRVLGEVVEEEEVDAAEAAVREAVGVVDEAPSAPTAPGATPTVPPKEKAVPGEFAMTPVLDATSDRVGAPHVLVVDDDGTNRMIARAVLEKEGYQVTEAADGAQALEILNLGVPFDLMVLDLDMPRISGDQVLVEVRSSLATAGLPVVVLTGTTDPDAEYRLLEQGADDYIRKPLDPPRLAVRVKAALRRAAG